MNMMYHYLRIQSRGVGYSSKSFAKKQPVMIFLIGSSGTDKSTWTRKFIRDRKDCVVVNRDTLRASLFCLTDQRDTIRYYQSPNMKNHEKTISSVVKSIVIEALREGKTIIMDNTNIDKKLLLEELKLATPNTMIRHEVFEPAGAAPTMEIQHEETKIRATTDYEVYESILKKQRNAFHDIRPQLSEIFSMRRSDEKIVQNKSLPAAIIFDIDGTLALNTGGRSPYDMSRVAEDTPNKHIVRAVHMYQEAADMSVILCSGREECGRRDTETWLRTHGIKYSELHMRPNKDMRKDYIVKEEFWKDICSRWHIVNMYDDRDQVVKHARHLGFNVCQVAEGNF